MRITESQLRRVIRDVIKESSYDDGSPGDIASHEYYPDMGMQQSDAGYQVSGGDGDPLQNFQGAEPGKQSHIDPMLQQQIEMASQNPSFLDALKRLLKRF